MNAALLRTLSIISAFIIGICFPALAEFGWLIRWLVVFMLFVTFLGVRVKGLRPARLHIWLVVMNVVMGLAPYFLLRYCGWNDLAKVAFFTSIAPTATSATVVMGFLGGSVEFMIVGLLSTSIVVCSLMPLLLPMVIGKALSVGVIWEVGKSMFFLLVVPLIPAFMVRRLTHHSLKWAKKLKEASFGVWVLALVLISAHATANIYAERSLEIIQVLQVMVLSLILCALNFGVGYILGGDKRKRESSQMLGQKNTVLVIFFAMTYADPLSVLGPTFYVLWHNLWNAWQLSLAGRKEKNVQ